MEFKDMINKIILGSALPILKTFPDKSIDMVITSPPYWGLRNYGHDDQIGLEKTFEEYIDHLIQIFSEVKRVLKDTGTCWVNIGDSYASSGGATRHFGYTDPKYPNGRNGTFEEPSAYPQSVLPKSLCGIPERFALAMTDRLGFIRRNTIIWFKKNCMPSSVRDRFTVDFEYLYFFSKQGKYYFEQQFEPLNWDTLRRSKARHSGPKAEQLAPAGFSNKASIRYAERLCSGEIPQARNKRCVWEINTIPFRGSHFAVFPEELVRTPILAGCPEFICNKCGKAREKVWKREYVGNSVNRGGHIEGNGKNCKGNVYNVPKDIAKKECIGYTDCGCNECYHSGIVLDPFMGSGTTALVALKLNRQFIGIEINPSYVEMANKRIRQEQEKQRLFST